MAIIACHSGRVSNSIVLMSIIESALRANIKILKLLSRLLWELSSYVINWELGSTDRSFLVLGYTGAFRRFADTED